jgi:hypothetical protein
MTPWKKLAAAFIPVAFAAAAGSAHAYGNCNVSTDDTKVWKPVAEMKAMLKGEGQKYLFPGAVAHKNQLDATNMHALLFVANPNNKVGHIIESNMPPGLEATLMCDAQAMVHTEKYPDNQAAIPPELYVPATKAAALRACRDLAVSGSVDRNQCGFINDDLVALNTKGIRTIVHGQAAKNIGKDGATEYIGVPNLMVYVLANLSAEYNGVATNVAGRIKNTMLPSGATINVGDIGFANFDNLAVNEKNTTMVAKGSTPNSP